MAQNEQLAAKVRNLFEESERKFIEKRIFGGAGFLINDNLACGIHGNELVVRVNPEKYDELIGKPDAKPFSMGGKKEMPGWLLVTEKGWASEKTLKFWVEEGMKFADSLPPKKKNSKRK